MPKQSTSTRIKKVRVRVAKGSKAIDSAKRKFARSVDPKSGIYGELSGELEKIKERQAKIENKLSRLEKAILVEMSEHLKARELRKIHERVRLPYEPLGWERGRIPELFEGKL